MPEHSWDHPEKALLHSYEGSTSDPQHSPDALVEARELNPWASETGSEWSTDVSQDRHRSVSRSHKIASTRERGVRPPGQQGVTTRIIGAISSQDTPTTKSYTPRGGPPWETNPKSSHCSESHSQDAHDFAKSNVLSNGTENLEHDELVHEIQRLQKRLDSLYRSDTDPDWSEDTSAQTKPWRIIHEVRCIDTGRWTRYFDEPKLEDDQDLMHLHWQGSRHVTSLKAWKRKQKPAFIIYRRYYCVHEPEKLLAHDERIHILSPKLDDGLMLWLEASSGLATYNEEAVYAENELKAPYLCFYHFRDEARQWLSAPESSSEESLLLLKYLDDSTAEVTSKSLNEGSSIVLFIG